VDGQLLIDLDLTRSITPPESQGISDARNASVSRNVSLLLHLVGHSGARCNYWEA